MSRLLKKSDIPFLEQGRWYTFFIESDGSTRTVTASDLECSIENGYIKLPEGFHEVDIVYDTNTVEQSAASSMIGVRRAFADGCQGFILPSASCFDFAYIYVFGYFGA